MAFLQRFWNYWVRHHDFLLSKHSEARNNHPKFARFFFAIGSLYLLNKAANFFSQLHILKSNLLNRYGEGSWAVVTGGSDGIGKAMCFELAKEGFNVAIISRTLSKMDQIAKELQEKYKIQTKIIQADFSQGISLSFFEEISKQLKDLDVSILVNNVGTAHEQEQFSMLCKGGMLQTIIVNAMSTLLMTKNIFNRLKSRDKKSAVITISSGLGLHNTPFSSVYGPTKSFQAAFSENLHNENKNDKIDFLVLCPMGVQTEMLNNHKGPFIISAEQFAKCCLQELKQGKSFSIGHSLHKTYIKRKFEWVSKRKVILNKIQTGKNLRYLKSLGQR